MDTPEHDITNLLNAWKDGDQAAFDELLPLVHAELKRMARRYMHKQKEGHTLQATALVNEAYLRMAGAGDKQFANRAHFFGVAAKAMRHVLVDYARSGGSAKRGGGQRPVALDDAIVIAPERLAEVAALDDALTLLAKLNLRHSQVVEMRYFGGLSVEETAKCLGVSVDTVMRDWRAAKAWLHRELSNRKF